MSAENATLNNNQLSHSSRTAGKLMYPIQGPSLKVSA